MLCPEGEGIHGDDGEHQAEERAGQPVAQTLRHQDDGEHAERDPEGPEVDVVELAEEIADLIDGGGPATGHSDHDRGEGHRGAVAGGPHHGDRRHPDGEHRRDRRIRAHREVGVSAEQGVEERAGCEGVEARDHGEVGETRRGHLRRHDHRDEGQTGERVGGQPRRSVAAERR